jgi:hypothetical protein
MCCFTRDARFSRFERFIEQRPQSLIGTRSKFQSFTGGEKRVPLTITSTHRLVAIARGCHSCSSTGSSTPRGPLQSSVRVRRSSAQVRWSREELPRIEYTSVPLSTNVSTLVCFKIEEKNRELSDKVFRQADYETIKEDRNKLREDIHRCEVENKR